MIHHNDAQDLSLFDVHSKKIYDKQGNKYNEYLNLSPWYYFYNRLS